VEDEPKTGRALEPDAQLLEAWRAAAPGSKSRGRLCLEMAARRSSTIVAPMAEYLTGPNEKDGVRAVIVLRHIGNTAAVAELKRSLATASPEVVAAAASSLAELGTRDAAPDLIACLERRGDELGGCRVTVIQALWKTPHVSAVPVLARYLHSGNRLTRSGSARALYRIDGPESLAALHAAVKEQSWWMSRFSRKALKLKGRRGEVV
jgi:HEAT repeat protein